MGSLFSLQNESEKKEVAFLSKKVIILCEIAQLWRTRLTQKWIMSHLDSNTQNFDSYESVKIIEKPNLCSFKEDRSQARARPESVLTCLSNMYLSNSCRFKWSLIKGQGDWDWVLILLLLLNEVTLTRLWILLATLSLREFKLEAGSLVVFSPWLHISSNLAYKRYVYHIC